MSMSSRIHKFSTSIFQEEDKGEKILDGYLSKKGNLNAVFNTQMYKSRWFVLYSNNTLSYYQDPTAVTSNESPLGELSLYNVTQIKEDDTNKFELITSKKTFVLKCDSTKELDQWLKKIKSRVSPNIVCKGWLYKKVCTHISYNI